MVRRGNNPLRETRGQTANQSFGRGHSVRQERGRRLTPDGHSTSEFFQACAEPRLALRGERL